MESTIVHHTCSAEGTPTDILHNAPFKSSYPLLGEGYYFWEDNIGRAHELGNKEYVNYVILEGKMNFIEGLFLDLCSRKHIHLFRMAVRELELLHGNNFRPSMSAIIEYLRQLSKFDPEVFPFKIIKFHFPYEEKPSVSHLDPTYVIFLSELDESILERFCIIYPKKYNEQTKEIKWKPIK